MGDERNGRELCIEGKDKGKKREYANAQKLTEG